MVNAAGRRKSPAIDFGHCAAPRCGAMCVFPAPSVPIPSTFRADCRIGVWLAEGCRNFGGIGPCVSSFRDSGSVWKVRPLKSEQLSSTLHRAGASFGMCPTSRTARTGNAGALVTGFTCVYAHVNGRARGGHARPPGEENATVPHGISRRLHSPCESNAFTSATAPSPSFRKYCRAVCRGHRVAGGTLYGFRRKPSAAPALISPSTASRRR